MTAEEIYIHNAIDKEKRNVTLNWRGYIHFAGASTAAALSYLLFSYAEPVVELSVGSVDSALVIPQDPALRTMLAGLIILIGLLGLFLVACFFHEIPIQDRRQFKNLKRKISDMNGQHREVLMQVESYALAGSDEWNRMKRGPPDEADIRATLQVNFVVTLMYALPITVIGL